MKSSEMAMIGSRATISAIALSAVLLFSAEAAGQANCPQNQSVYVEEKSGAILEFMPNDAGAATYFHMELRLPSGQVFVGDIGWGNGFSVPSGSLARNDCETEADNDCGAWGALVYQLGPDGIIDWIGNGDAAEQVLLPELSSELFFLARALQANWLTPRSDTFFLVRCTTL